MSTGRELVSTVRSTHKLLSTDALITDRVIYAVIKNATLLLVKRETNLRKLWATDTIFTTIPCLEMVEVPISECCEYVDPCMVSRSKYKIPQISEGNYQYTIQGVYSINAMGGGKKFKEVTINRFINLKKLGIIKREIYYWIVNGYLYTNNPLLKALRLTAFFEEDVANEIMFPECGCGEKATNEEMCKNPLDKPFPLPGYMKQPVLQLVTQELLNTYFRLKTDITVDGIDGQAPNAKPTN